MRIKTHVAKLVFLSGLIMGILVFAAVPFSVAIGQDKSGTADDTCSQYFVLSKPVLVSGKALSADTFEYNFSVSMTEGNDNAVCADSLRGEPYTARVTGSWDEKTRTARETITHQAPAKAKLHEFVMSCPENPWTSERAVKCSTTGTKCEPTVCKPGDYKCSIICTYYTFFNAPPESALLLTKEDRLGMGRTVTWGTGSFVLPPTLPPKIIVDDMEDSDSVGFSRGQDAKITVVRPADGSAQWYANPWRYDLETEANVADGGRMATGWTKKSIMPSTPGRDRSDISLSYGRFFDDPPAQWRTAILARGQYRQARIRARVHDDTILRPWSNWRYFYMETPLVKAPAAGTSIPAAAGSGSGGKPDVKVGVTKGTNVPTAVAPRPVKNVPAR